MRRRWWVAAAALGLGVAGLLGTGTLSWRPRRSPAFSANRPSLHRARILRDTYGVPHVFGRTDPDVAFGLAYAHAEDDFGTIEDVLLAARGQLALVHGRSAAPNDYMVRLLRVWRTVDEGWARDLDPRTRALCDAYADGLNLFAARHPDAAYGELFPVRGQDVVAGFVHKLPLFFGIDRTLLEIVRAAPPPLRPRARAVSSASPGSVLHPTRRPRRTPRSR